LMAIATSAASCQQAPAGAMPERRSPSPVIARPLADRLAAGRARMPELAPVGRNPFRFGAVPAASTARSRMPPADTLPELPLPLPRPALRLLGIAQEGAEKTAVLSVAGDLVLAHEGDHIAGRFLISRITQDAVELTDPAAGATIRVPLP
jgi:hypothetical protein